MIFREGYIVLLCFQNGNSPETLEEIFLGREQLHQGPLERDEPHDDSGAGPVEQHLQVSVSGLAVFCVVFEMEIITLHLHYLFSALTANIKNITNSM